MNFVHRGMTMAATILLASTALGAAPALTAGLERPDASETATMAATRSSVSTPTATRSSQAATSTVRRVEADAITGSEPDPESFDGKGLEIWWQHYQEALKKAE